MTYGSNAYRGPTAVDHRHSPRKARPLATLGNASLALIALACAATLYVNLGGPGFEAQASLEREGVAHDVIALPVTDSGFTVTAPPIVTFAERFFDKAQEIAAAPAARKGDRLQVVASIKPSDTLKADDVETVAALPPAAAKPDVAPAIQQASLTVPLPMPRPAELKALADSKDAKGPSPREIAQAKQATKNASLTASAKAIFEKLFGKHEPAGAVLAYAGSDGGIPTGGVMSDGKVSLKPPFDRETAVYDITAKTVYLPDGTKLEAHSGLGDKMDDPNYVHVRMRGATPPHVYDLAMRESLFHGVEAIRLKPVGGEEAIHGRTGLLAHTYMLGPNGDSNGCVSFKDYEKFLAAYKNNQIKRLAVISSLN